MAKKIFVMNLGSTSSKVAYYEGTSCVYTDTIKHSSDELAQFADIYAQYPFRLSMIRQYMDERGLRPEDMDAIVTRGPMTRPVPGGVYRINDTMIEQAMSGNYGSHATNLGAKIAHTLCSGKTIPVTVDTPATDEFSALARYSGIPEIKRHSSMHALNHKAVARKYAEDIGRAYEELKLVVAHLGGGISVAAHEQGLIVDANNALDGDGPFCTNRSGALTVSDIVDMCYSGKYTYEEMCRKYNGKGGMEAYLGENDIRTVEEKAFAGDIRYAETLDAMIYQTCKEIGAYAAVLRGQVDAILLTGGMANSKYIVGKITEAVSFIAKVHTYPGEFEMEALARGAYDALTGKRSVLEM